MAILISLFLASSFDKSDKYSLDLIEAVIFGDGADALHGCLSIFVKEQHKSDDNKGLSESPPIPASLSQHFNIFFSLTFFSLSSYEGEPIFEPFKVLRLPPIPHLGRSTGLIWRR